MLHAAAEGALALREESDGGRTLSGRFPYGATAVLSDGGRQGRPRKERFKSRAFEYRVNDPEAEIHLLVGHDYAKPLAAKLAGGLTLADGDDALTFEARIDPAVAETSYGRDALALIAAGLAVGLSPGFRIPPERAVKDAEEVEQEPDEGAGSDKRGALIRTVTAALLYELSIVTKPAYSESQVEARSWRLPATMKVVPNPMFHPMSRWR